LLKYVLSIRRIDSWPQLKEDFAFHASQIFRECSVRRFISRILRHGKAPRAVANDHHVVVFSMTFSQGGETF